ncbi:MAG: hypothetical protein ACTS6J_06615 [Burkholderiales bacterium]
MKFTTLALSVLLGMGAGCASLRPAYLVSTPDLPNCFDSNYDKEKDLFTIKNDAGNPVNQQCLLTVGPGGDIASTSRLKPGSYTVYLSNGGGGGAGGTLQAFHGGGGGGGGGGGAGAAEIQAEVDLTEGVYLLTIGAGGLGGSVCVPVAHLGGGPGWLGSPSNIIRIGIVTDELVMGIPGAEKYVRPKRGRLEKTAGKMDAHGGSGPGQTSGGRGGSPETRYQAEAEAGSGASRLASGRSGVGGAAGGDQSAVDKSASEGGGGGAARLGSGGTGSGETLGHKDTAPQRGSLGSGGGGGEGTAHQCDAGARGGHGYIALRPI